MTVFCCCCTCATGPEKNQQCMSAMQHMASVCFSSVSQFPTVALLVFGSLCLLVILALVVISQQAKWVFTRSCSQAMRDSAVLPRRSLCNVSDLLPYFSPLG